LRMFNRKSNHLNNLDYSILFINDIESILKCQRKRAFNHTSIIQPAQNV